MDYTKTDTISDLVGECLRAPAARSMRCSTTAPMASRAPSRTCRPTSLRVQFETNVFGWHELTRQIIPVMRRRGPRPDRPMLVHSRHRALSLARRLQCLEIRARRPELTMRMELQGSGIEVSLIEPGPIASRFTANALTKIEAHIDIRQFGPCGGIRAAARSGSAAQAAATGKARPGSGL